jgi:hypothetical protein
VRDGDVEARADLAQARKRAAEQVLTVAAAASAALGDVEGDRARRVDELLGERGAVAPDARERGLQAADEVEREVVGEKAHGVTPWLGFATRSESARDAR